MGIARAISLWIAGWISLGLIAECALAAEPLRVQLESIRLDCAKCPELLTRYERAKKENDPTRAAERLALAELEKAAKVQVEFRHVQEIAPLQRSRQTTQLGDSSLEVMMLVKPMEGEIYVIDLSYDYMGKKSTGGDHTQVQTSVVCTTGESVVFGESISRGLPTGFSRKLELQLSRFQLNSKRPAMTP